VADEELEAQVEAVAALKDPVRRALYLFVAAAGREVSREEAAKAVGVTRALAAFHLDKLVDEGLLDTAYRRVTGRVGPGAGRTSKLYRRSGRQLEVSLPARNYELAARLFARALAPDHEQSPLERVDEEATALGRAVGEQARAKMTHHSLEARLSTVLDVLRDYGFEPYREGNTVYLRNCPFHSLALENPEVVCGMNHSLLRGVLSGLRASGLDARLQPEAGRCCIAIAAGDEASRLLSGATGNAWRPTR
jgi:predicted ArsR family transcriptional regulator